MADSLQERPFWAMLIEYNHSILVLTTITTLLAIVVRIRFRKGIRRIPGPFWASVSSIDRLITAASGRQFRKHLEYHETYGSLVRVGPNHVSFSNADLIPKVYGITSRFYKSKFYTMFDVKSKQGKVVSTVFSVRDAAQHKSLKRPVANAYSMSTLVELEPMTDACIEIFQRKLSEKQGQTIDFGQWLQWYSFDVITSVTFSNRMGFMEQEKDIGGIIDAIEGRLAYNCVIGETPLLHRLLLGNPLFAWCSGWVPILQRLNSSSYIVRFAASQLERYATSDKAKAKDSARDMLARFKRVKDGEKTMTDDDLLSHASSNIFAGSDTTAISLRSMFYYLIKSPRCYSLLEKEIQQADERGELSPIVSFAESGRLKYLQACMKEAMRMHPAVGQLLERVVPEEGFQVSKDIFLPSGTIVGINPWLPSRDSAVYGEDVEKFRPERWIEADDIALKLMERNFLAFGAGARTCLGKNISLLEMSKLVPQLIRNYTIELADPQSEWVLTDHWFVKQSNLICRIARREKV